MYTLQLSNGDLSMGGNGVLTKLSGAERIAQELRCWLLEPIGTDILYPDFGSDLGSYIGMPIGEESLMDVRAEVTRVVNNYIAYQKRYIESTSASSWDSADIIRTVNSINVSSVADTVTVNIRLTTVSGEPVVVTRTL